MHGRDVYYLYVYLFATSTRRACVLLVLMLLSMLVSLFYNFQSIVSCLCLVNITRFVGKWTQLTVKHPVSLCPPLPYSSSIHFPVVFFSTSSPEPIPNIRFNESNNNKIGQQQYEQIKQIYILPNGTCQLVIIVWL